MSNLPTVYANVRPDPAVEQRIQATYRRQMLRGELYALGVLVGLQLSVVYVIGSLVVSCVGW